MIPTIGTFISYLLPADSAGSGGEGEEEDEEGDSEIHMRTRSCH